MDKLVQDFRSGIRSLSKNPGFAVVAVVTLALAIGVNTAIFSMVNVVLFIEMPVNDPDSFMLIYGANQRHDERRLGISLPELRDLLEQSQVFEDLSATTSALFVMTGGDEPVRANAWRVTDNAFRVWGLETVVGRDFRPGEDQPGSERLTILSHGLWERQFGSNPDVIGTQLRLDEELYTIVGVMGPQLEFGSLASIDVFVPLDMDLATADRDQRNLFVQGRLKPGATMEQARQEMAMISARFEQQYPATSSGWTIEAHSLYEEIGQGDTYEILILLSVTVGFVLLIACANVANMLIARATSREKEIAVRSALGAGRVNLLRQMIVENMIMSVVAAGIGFFLAKVLVVSLQSMTSTSPATLWGMIELDRNVLLFTMAVAVLTPLLFGLLPSLRASRPNLNETLKEGSGRFSGGVRGLRLRGLLVATQVALAMMAMIVAGLMAQSVVNVMRIESGIGLDDALTLRLDLPESKYGDDESVRLFFDEVSDRIAAQPGVDSVVLVNARPMLGTAARRSFLIEGQAASEEWEMARATRFVAGVGYFAAMQIPLIRGRTFDLQDSRDSEPVVIVNRTAVGRYWPDQDPLGQRIKLGNIESDAPWREVVGVVGDVLNPDIENLSVPQIYLPFAQGPARGMAVIVSAGGDPTAMAGAVRAEIWAVDPDQPIDDVRTLARIDSDLRASGLAILTLFVTFAGFALAMASIGIYGVMSYSVSQRTHEIGIRMALGARGSDVLRMVARQGITVLIAGTAVGLAGALLVARLVAAIVYEVSPTDPVIFGGVVAVLALVALLANYLPARRATRVDPLISLRTE